MAVSMGNAIRYLKWEIAQVPLDMEEEEVRHGGHTGNHLLSSWAG